MRKEYTHAKGFNVTSLKGVAGLYFFHNAQGDVLYIGKCNGDFKNRINSHFYGPNGKLSADTIYIRIVLVDPNIYPLYVLENLFIWYFNPLKNMSLSLFSNVKNNVKLKQIAEAHHLYISGSVTKFVRSFETVLLKREFDEYLKFKKYGDVENLLSNRVICNSNSFCLCYRCLVTTNRGSHR